jgi:hypothetical protein
MRLKTTDEQLVVPATWSAKVALSNHFKVHQLPRLCQNAERYDLSFHAVSSVCWSNDLPRN